MQVTITKDQAYFLHEVITATQSLFIGDIDHMLGIVLAAHTATPRTLLICDILKEGVAQILKSGINEYKYDPSLPYKLRLALASIISKIVDSASLLTYDIELHENLLLLREHCCNALGYIRLNFELLLSHISSYFTFHSARDIETIRRILYVFKWRIFPYSSDTLIRTLDSNFMISGIQLVSALDAAIRAILIN